MTGLLRSGSAGLFDRWSDSYDNPRLQTDTYRPVHDAVLARLAVDAPEAGWSTVLDLGCGTGWLTARLAEAHPDATVIGLDYSQGMLGRAVGRNLRAGVALVRADAQGPPIRAGAVDVIVCTESFHWYQDQAGALDSAADVLGPGGRILIASIATVTAAGRRAVQAVSSAVGQPVRARPPGEVRRLLERSGFGVIHQRRVPRPGLVPWPVLTDAVRR